MRNFEKDNTVAAENQLPQEQRLTSAEGGAAFRVLFVGNSITRHGPKPDIGWPWDWGMAASSIENDYVHLFMRMLKCLIPGASHRIAQAASWERAYWQGADVLREFESALTPGNDLIVVRIGENILPEDMEKYPLEPAFEEMLRFFGKKRRTPVDDRPILAQRAETSGNGSGGAPTECAFRAPERFRHAGRYESAGPVRTRRRGGASGRPWHARHRGPRLCGGAALYLADAGSVALQKIA